MRVELVIARYQENMLWLNEIHNIYIKGQPLEIDIEIRT